MDFKNIPNTYHPAYTWLWNSTVTQEGIKLQLEEMYAAGIRAFYVIEYGNALQTHLPQLSVGF